MVVVIVFKHKEQFLQIFKNNIWVRNYFNSTCYKNQANVKPFQHFVYSTILQFAILAV